MPDLELPSTSNRRVNLARVSAPRLVVYAYPMTGRPDRTLPAGWDDIPGARGCTPETCGFRDHHKDLATLQAEVFGVSTQSTAYQQEMVTRLAVPFDVLSDEHFALTRALRLPTFTVDGMTLMKRLTLIVRNGPHRARLLSGVPARHARRGSDRLVEGAPDRRPGHLALMPAKNPDLHGNVPDSSPVALLLIDVINDLEFEGAERARARRRCRWRSGSPALKRRASARRHSGDLRQRQLRPLAVRLHALVEHCLEDGVRGEPLARTAAARRRRLLRAEAEALGVLLDDARHPARATSAPAR